MQLTTKTRKDLPDSAFALPGRRYPIHDAAHARDALARASEAFRAGHLSAEERATVTRKAHAVLKTDDEKNLTDGYGRKKD